MYKYNNLFLSNLTHLFGYKIDYTTSRDTTTEYFKIIRRDCLVGNTTISFNMAFQYRITNIEEYVFNMYTYTVAKAGHNPYFQETITKNNKNKIFDRLYNDNLIKTLHSEDIVDYSMYYKLIQTILEENPFEKIFYNFSLNKKEKYILKFGL